MSTTTDILMDFLTILGKSAWEIDALQNAVQLWSIMHWSMLDKKHQRAVSQILFRNQRLYMRWNRLLHAASSEISMTLNSLHGSAYECAPKTFEKDFLVPVVLKN